MKRRRLEPETFQLNSSGSNCGSVGRAVTSNTRGTQFESSHQQILHWTFCYCQLYWKDEKKEKEARNGTFFKKHPNSTENVKDCTFVGSASYCSKWWRWHVFLNIQKPVECKIFSFVIWIFAPRGLQNLGNRGRNFLVRNFCSILHEIFFVN